jgi:3-deoxy-D-manno-octulosonate 8-phosphate phosphatase (KDO 8-P phosphatase)
MSHDPRLIELLALDVDGVLTDGSIIVDDRNAELKRFNVRDGFGIVLWQKLGFRTAIITGRDVPVTEHRAAQLKISFVIQGAADKSGALDQLCRRAGLPPQRVAFVGDDWPDLSIMRRVGYAIAVADAEPRLKEIAAYVTRAPGGRGAVREAIEHLIAAKGLMGKALAMYDSEHAAEPTPPT